MIDIAGALQDLSKKRDVFHSEADFQHAFAWEVHRQLPDADVRLEVPYELKGKPVHVDIIVNHGSSILAIELKYKTRKIKIERPAEHFALKDQSAQDCGRYDFIKDIVRLEDIANSHEGAVGYAILLTNDNAYWKKTKKTDAVDSDFRFHQECVLQGTLKWGDFASEGTKRGREKTLELQGKYSADWKDYSMPGEGSYGIFRYISVKVPA